MVMVFGYSVEFMFLSVKKFFDFVFLFGWKWFFVYVGCIGFGDI